MCGGFASGERVCSLWVEGRLVGFYGAFGLLWFGAGFVNSIHCVNRLIFSYVGGGVDVAGGGGVSLEVEGEEVAVEVVLLPGVGEAQGHVAGAAVHGGGKEAAPLGGVVDVEVDVVHPFGAVPGAVFVEVDGEDAVGGNVGRGGRHRRHRPLGEAQARVVDQKGWAHSSTLRVPLP